MLQILGVVGFVFSIIILGIAINLLSDEAKNHTSRIEPKRRAAILITVALITGLPSAWFTLAPLSQTKPPPALDNDQATKPSIAATLMQTPSLVLSQTIVPTLATTTWLTPAVASASQTPEPPATQLPTLKPTSSSTPSVIPQSITPPFADVALGEIRGVCGKGGNRDPNDRALDVEPISGEQNLPPTGNSFECWVRVAPTTSIPTGYWQIGMDDPPNYYLRAPAGIDKPTFKEFFSPDTTIKYKGDFSARITRSRFLATEFFGSNAYQAGTPEPGGENKYGFFGNDQMHVSIWYRTDGNANAQMAVLHHHEFDDENASIIVDLPEQLGKFENICRNFTAGGAIILAMRVQGSGTLWVDDAFTGHGNCPIEQ